MEGFPGVCCAAISGLTSFQAFPLNKVRLDFHGSVVLVRTDNFPQTANFRVFLKV